MRGPMACAAVLRAAVLICFALGLSGCSTTGNSFRSSAMWQIVPGQTTLEQASDILEAEPVDTYQNQDGTMIARWAHKASMVVNALYFRQELWLKFGPDGTFERVVKKVNLPPSDHVGMAPDPMMPPAQSAAAAAPPSVAVAPAPAPPPAAPTTVWTQPLTDTAVAYPLNNP